MTQYIAHRVASIVPVLLGISIVVFLLVHLIPGDTVQILLGTESNPEQVATLRRVLGLDRPLPVQYVDWLSHVLRGDLGDSLRTNRAVLPEVGARFGVTI